MRSIVKWRCVRVRIDRIKPLMVSEESILRADRSHWFGEISVNNRVTHLAVVVVHSDPRQDRILREISRTSTR